MKIAAILLMLLGIVLIVGFGSLYLLGFVMSFDAPGSTTDPKGWAMRLLIFLPVVALIVLLILAFLAFYSGHYKRSVIIGSLFPIIGVGVFLYMSITTAASMNDYRSMMEQEKADALKYPIQKFLRHGEVGADTIIVFPNRIVAYRLNVDQEFPHNGPLGDLNPTRDTLIYERRPDTKIKIEELYHFMDEEGRVFTNVYAVR